jgi:hypothetical protein
MMDGPWAMTGQGISVLKGFGFSPESRTVLPGGFVVIYLWAQTPSLFNRYTI